MKVVKITDLGNLTSDQAVTVALNNATVCDSSIMVNVETETTGGNIEASASNSVAGQDSNPIKVVTPRYLPRAKQGCKAVVVMDSSTASGTAATVGQLVKEFETYSYLIDGSDIIVWGVLNYDQIDDAYTPVIGQSANGTEVHAFWH